jgi:hypothetical protein
MSKPIALVPETITPDELALKLGASPRRVKDDVRALGCYCKIGAKVVMREHHVEAFMEAMECQSKSTSAAKFGTTGVLLPEGDHAALVARRTRKPLRGSRQKSRPQAGVVTLMDQRRT